MSIPSWKVFQDSDGAWRALGLVNWYFKKKHIKQYVILEHKHKLLMHIKHIEEMLTEKEEKVAGDR